MAQVRAYSAQMGQRTIPGRLDIEYRSKEYAPYAAVTEIIVRSILFELGLSHFSLQIELIGLEEMQNMNLRTRGIAAPTDVLSFPEHEPEGPLAPISLGNTFFDLGRVALCIPYIREQALSRRQKAKASSNDAATAAIQNYSDETIIQAEYALVLTHGILHLAGFDHHTQQDRDLMQATSERLVRRLAFCGIIPSEAIEISSRFVLDDAPDQVEYYHALITSLRQDIRRELKTDTSLTASLQELKQEEDRRVGLKLKVIEKRLKHVAVVGARLKKLEQSPDRDSDLTEAAKGEKPKLYPGPLSVPMEWLQTLQDIESEALTLSYSPSDEDAVDDIDDHDDLAEDDGGEDPDEDPSGLEQVTEGEAQGVLNDLLNDRFVQESLANPLEGIAIEEPPVHSNTQSQSASHSSLGSLKRIVMANEVIVDSATGQALDPRLNKASELSWAQAEKELGLPPGSLSAYRLGNSAPPGPSPPGKRSRKPRH